MRYTGVASALQFSACRQAALPTRLVYAAEPAERRQAAMVIVRRSTTLTASCANAQGAIYTTLVMFSNVFKHTRIPDRRQLSGNRRLALSLGDPSWGRGLARLGMENPTGYKATVAPFGMFSGKACRFRVLVRPLAQNASVGGVGTVRDTCGSFAKPTNFPIPSALGCRYPPCKSLIFFSLSVQLRQPSTKTMPSHNFCHAV